MENKIVAMCISSMDILGDNLTILILAFVVFVFLTCSPPKDLENQGDQGDQGDQQGQQGQQGQTGGRRRHGPRRGRRDFFGYYGDYWNVFNPWRINNPCANYAAKKCRGNYYYEPCYESKYFRCMNSTFYA